MTLHELKYRDYRLTWDILGYVYIVQAMAQVNFFSNAILVEAQ